jgi:hypothetical protein
MKIFEKKKYSSSKESWYFCGKKILSLPVFLKPFVKHENLPKFGVSYSVFDGEELLEASIRSIRSEVSYVNVVYQLISWRGNQAEENMLKTLKDIQKEGLIDELIFWEPDLKKSPNVNETDKRNVGLRAAINAGVNYFMTMDCDEFYREDEVRRAKQIILEKEITHSYCKQIFYGDRPTLRIMSAEKCDLQFFCKVDKFSILGGNEFAPHRVDPTRKLLEREGSKHYFLNDIAMHHFRDLRKNKMALRSKYANSALDGAKQIAYSEKDCVEVENYFKLPTF